LEIHSFKSLPSTQIYLVDKISSGELAAPIAVIAAEQTDGIGSRENRWSGGEGNFFASVALTEEMLPQDLPLSAASIYFGFLMKKVLCHNVDEVWIKWPNDIYKADAKVGGIITKKLSDILVVGIGINLQKNQNGYSSLDTDISPLILLNMFLKEVEKKPKWKQIFSQYRIEFALSKFHFTHQNGLSISMENAVLCDDGSLTIDGGKVYSLR